MNTIDDPAQTPTVIISKSSFPFFRFAIPIICLTVGVGIGFGINQLLPVKKIEPAPSQPIKKSIPIPEADLPISITLLKNPIVYQWQGAVEGTLVAKDDNSITVKDDKGNSLIIPLKIPPDEKMNALFIDLNKGAKRILLDEIPISSRLRGNFYVIPGDKNRIVGGSFTIIKKATP